MANGVCDVCGVRPAMVRAQVRPGTTQDTSGTPAPDAAAGPVPAEGGAKAAE